MKDRKLKAATKPILDKIEEEFERNSAQLKAKLIDKLFILTNGKTSQGVKDYLSIDVIPKGAKFSLRVLQDIDYMNVNPLRWTTEKPKNDMIKQLINNFILKYKEVDAIYKRKNTTLPLAMNSQQVLCS